MMRHAMPTERMHSDLPPPALLAHARRSCTPLMTCSRAALPPCRFHVCQAACVSVAPVSFEHHGVCAAQMMITPPLCTVWQAECQPPRCHVFTLLFCREEELDELAEDVERLVSCACPYPFPRWRMPCCCPPSGWTPDRPCAGGALHMAQQCAAACRQLLPSPALPALQPRLRTSERLACCGPAGPGAALVRHQHGLHALKLPPLPCCLRLCSTSTMILRTSSSRSGGQGHVLTCSRIYPMPCCLIDGAAGWIVSDSRAAKSRAARRPSSAAAHVLFGLLKRLASYSMNWMPLPARAAPILIPASHLCSN